MLAYSLKPFLRGDAISIEYLFGHPVALYWNIRYVYNSVRFSYWVSLESLLFSKLIADANMTSAINNLSCIRTKYFLSTRI